MNIIKLILAFCISWIICYVLIKASSYIKIFDHPDSSLKPHVKPIPYLGGLAFLIGSIPVFPFSISVYIFLCVISSVGFTDDIVSLSPVIRIILTFATALIFYLIYFGYQGIVISILTVILLLVLVNIVNWSDGMDGLLAGNAIINLVGMYFVLKSEHTGLPFLCLILICALAGYLFWNFNPAKIYMGDGGSYFIGSIFYFIIMHSVIAKNYSVLVSLVLNMSLFFIDGIFSITRRFLSGRQIILGDRDHYYDKLYRKIGGSERKKTRITVLLSYILNAAYVFLGYVFNTAELPFIFIGVSWVIVSFFLVFWLQLYKYDNKASVYESSIVGS